MVHLLSAHRAGSIATLLVAGLAAACSQSGKGAVERGRYLVNVSSCNDCHSVDYMQKGPAVPEADRLTGTNVGFTGPWGTTYPANLRLTVQKTSEEDWLKMLKTRQGLPPMPWPAVNTMSEADARAIYAYLKSLGAKGEPAPAALPPGEAPKTPYYDFVPKTP
jgi:mono/diheme cytochrome c family protein